MKVLSIYDPWATLIVMGVKPVENRSWYTSYRGELYIHSCQKMDYPENVAAARRMFARDPNRSGRLTWPETFQLGGIIGKVTLVDITQSNTSIWAVPYQFHWVFEDPEPVPFMPCRGYQRIWDYDPFEDLVSGDDNQMKFEF